MRQAFQRTCAALLLLAASATGPIQAQTEVPANPDLDRIYSDMSAALWVSSFGPVLAPTVEAQRIFIQSMLWSYRLEVEDALMTAWTTQSMLQLDQQVRMAVAAGQHIVEIVKEDLTWYQEEYDLPEPSGATLPGFTPRNRIEEQAFARYQALHTLLTEIEPPLTETGPVVLTTFDQVRAGVLQGYARPMLIRDGSSVATAMLAFQEAAAEAEQAILDAVALGIQVPIGATMVNAPITPMRHVRLDIVNESTDLVFFIRLWSRGDDGSFSMRADTASWLVVYPNDAVVRLSETGPAGPVDTSLPNAVWLLARAEDRIEIRVATYGEYRQRIRWQEIAGTTVLPELASLRRGFYYLGYESRATDTAALVSRLYPIEESYEWRFAGLWERERTARFEETPPTELRETLTDQLLLSNDHLVWDLPDLQTIREHPLIHAAVSGTATMGRFGPRGPADPVAESGSGELFVEMTLW